MLVSLAVADAALAEVGESWTELLSRKVAGPVAWAALIEQHQRRVVVALLARGIGVEQAKELAQEAWLRLMLRHRAGKLTQLRLPGLAIKQALFLAKDQARKRWRTTSLQAPSMSGSDPANGGAATLSDSTAGWDLEDQLVARSELRRVQRVIADSSPRARRVFRLLHGQPPMTQSHPRHAPRASWRRAESRFSPAAAAFPRAGSPGRIGSAGGRPSRRVQRDASTAFRTPSSAGPSGSDSLGRRARPERSRVRA